MLQLHTLVSNDKVHITGWVPATQPTSIVSKLSWLFTDNKHKIIIGVKGGAGSGNWAHGGRPGKEGGSAPGKGGGVGASATIKPGQTPNLKFQPPEGMKLPEHKPGDESGLADYKAWYQAASAAGQTPSLQQAIQMRQYLAERAAGLEQQAGAEAEAKAEAAANTPEAKAAAAAAAEEEAKKKAELAKKVADAKKKKKGGGAKKKAAEKKPKAGKAPKEPKEKEPQWKKGLVEPPIMSGTKIPEAVYEEHGEETYQKWLNDNPDTVKNLNDDDKAEIYDYFTKRSQNLAKYAKDAWARVYIPDMPFDMVNAGVTTLPKAGAVTGIQALLQHDKPAPSDAVGKALYDYLKALPEKQRAEWDKWYKSRRHAEHQKSIIPVTKPQPGTKEHKIIIRVGLKSNWRYKVKGSSGSGNWGHRGIPGKIGGSQPKSAGVAPTSADWEQRRQLKVTLANQKFPDGGFASGQAAQDWANKAYPGTEFNLADGGHTVINPTLKAYSDLAKQYPDVAKSIKQVTIGSTGMGSNPIIISRDGSKVTLSNDWFTRNNAAELRDATREAVKAGFYPAGSGIGHYMTHAFGVRVMEHLASNPAAGARMIEWLNGNFSKAKSVSAYAMSGKTEFFGELFSALHGGKSKAPVVQEFGALLTALSDIKSGKKEIIIRVGLKGGPGSGNHGHRGIPGKLGGSAPKSTGAGAGSEIVKPPEPKKPLTGADAVQMVGDIHDKYESQREELRVQDAELDVVRNDLFKQIRAMTEAKDDDGIIIAKQKLGQVTGKQTELYRQIKTLDDKEKQEIFDKVLKVDDPINMRVNFSGIAKDKQKATPGVQEGIGTFQQMVSQKAVPVDVLGVNMVVLNKSGRSFYTDGIGVTLYGKYSANSTKSTVVHEFGHALEHYGNNRSRVRKFLEERTKNETAKHISGYDKNEIFKPDNFADSYIGKIYKAGHTEVLSMGLQMFVDDPWKFAMKDPQHFALTWEIARGIK